MSWKEGLEYWTEHRIHEIQGTRSHVSNVPFDQSTHLGHLSHLDSCYHSRSKKTTTPSGVDWVGELVFFRLVPYREFSLQCWLLFWEFSGATPHMCDVLVFQYFVLTLADGLCCAWFPYPVLCWCRCPKIGTSSINWAQLSRFYLKTHRIQSLKRCVLNKNRRWIMFRNIIIACVFGLQVQDSSGFLS
jgi:hypothetical protein